LKGKDLFLEKDFRVLLIVNFSLTLKIFSLCDQMHCNTILFKRHLNKKVKQSPSCKLEDKNKSCCGSSSTVDPSFELKSHWDQAYLTSPESQLGWFEEDFKSSFQLIDQCKLNPNEPCLLIGSGSSRLPDQMLEKRQSDIIVSDISEVAIQNVKDRIGENLNYRVGDILDPQTLEGIPPVQLWFDRAVLHFFTEKNDQETYFNVLKEKVKPRGYVILAEFNLSGAEKCSGLPVFRYDEKMYQQGLGEEFKLLDTFNHNYIMPSGEIRPYIYALYQRTERS
jgi:hypothetical protein